MKSKEDSLLHVITGRYCFFIKIYRYHVVLFNTHVLAFFETSDLKEVCVFLSPE